ncbi:tRNA (adenosine(37)-N6)-threonylcarbamoyltransferase complex dimerization subunit type 1 TsaB [Moraxella sp. ZJ142]|uniref:tRNA (adenosine(37)-N6)-threonylcarbamoyltransferase complex dimerization subunit type 1 TsaB n=1 Tax=Moraxella marmotae TaxID=3344520 RepID=UPI0035D52129
MTTLMAFDTVFEQCSLAIVQDNTVIYQQTIAGNRGQTEIILSMVDVALAASGLGLNEIDCLAFNRGPGAFSGIRINTAVVQALAVAADVPCVGVSSLAVLADTAQLGGQYADDTSITAVMDARQNQLYAGHFVIKNGKATPIIQPNNPYGNEGLLDYGSQLVADVITGDGTALVESAATVAPVQPTAVDIARLAWHAYQAGQAVVAEQALPVYLRDNAWKTLAQQGKH